MPTVEKSWHTEGEWFVRLFGGYRGEVMYAPESMRWHARPWRVLGRMTGQWFDDMQDAINHVAAA